MAENTPGEDTIQEKFAVASFTVRNERVAFAYLKDELQGGNRLVQHRRPYRVGAKIDSTGPEPKQFSFRAIFNNSVSEPGLPDSPVPYPNAMNRMIELFDIQETGDLMSPVDGLKRVRALSYKREQPEGETDTGYLDLTFVEDNEDAVDADAFSQPSVQGSLTRLADITVFSAERDGIWNQDLISIQEFAAELEALMRFPGEYANAVVTQQRTIVRAARSVMATANQERVNNQALLEDTPVGSVFRLLRVLDVAGYALEEKNGNRPKAIDYQVLERTNIFAIASSRRTPVDALLDLNAQRIDDPLQIEPGTYKVYESWP